MSEPKPRLFFHVGSESDCELIVERTGPENFTFTVAHYAAIAVFGPEPFPLGRFLVELGLTAEDCAAALASERTNPR